MVVCVSGRVCGGSERGNASHSLCAAKEWRQERRAFLKCNLNPPVLTVKTLWCYCGWGTWNNWSWRALPPSRRQTALGSSKQCVSLVYIGSYLFVCYPCLIVVCKVWVVFQNDRFKNKRKFVKKNGGKRWKLIERWNVK